MMLHIPDTIKEALTAYCSKDGQKGKPHTVNLKITNGGVMSPPTIAKQCCSPMRMAIRYGISSSES